MSGCDIDLLAGRMSKEGKKEALPVARFLACLFAHSCMGRSPFSLFASACLLSLLCLSLHVLQQVTLTLSLSTASPCRGCLINLT